MPKKSKFQDQTAFALEVLKSENLAVGAFIEVIDEGDNTWSYLFKSELKGYLDWRWSVTLYQPEGAEPTLSEYVLLPGEGSLVAPDWVPWSERLADYKALQAELEAQAALDAEEAEDAEDVEEDSEDDDDVEIVDVDEDELLAPVADQGESAESDSEDAGQRPPRSRGRNRRGKNKKND
jgi:hypothetical protein